MRVKITYSSAKPKKKYNFGDRREIGGVTHVRCRVFDSFYGAFVVNSNGTPKVEWVPEKNVDETGIWPIRKRS